MVKTIALAATFGAGMMLAGAPYMLALAMLPVAFGFALFLDGFIGRG